MTSGKAGGLIMCEPLKAVDSGATWRWLSLKHCHLIQATILLLLLPDILADRLLVRANGRHKVSPGPEMLTRKVLLSSHVRPGDVNGTFAFQIAYHLSHCILGRYRDQHVYMIGQKMPFNHPTLSLHGEFSKC